jgi:shikimate dehydrogenase
LVGSNTDGAAALNSLEDKVGSLVDKNILLLGLGGAGKAVATYVANAKANVTIWNRTTEKAVDFADRFKGSDLSVSAIESISSSIMKKCGLLINCTSLGYSSDGALNAAMPIDIQSLKSLPDFALVYDIIYQPLKSSLLTAAESRGLDTMNGLKMNLDQAVIAFCKAFPNSNYASVVNAMQKN